MKTKVLKYKFDGNTVVAPYMELEAYAENVYLSLSKKNKYGNDHEDIFHVVCKIENVYFSYGQYSRRILGNEEHKKKLSGIAKLDCGYTSGCGERKTYSHFVYPCF